MLSSAVQDSAALAVPAFYAVRTLLTDSARRKGPGPAPRWLGSGIYRCGICTPPGVEADKPVT